MKLAPAMLVITVWMTSLSAEPVSISAQVVDDETGQPVAGATIEVVQSGLMLTSGSDGRFTVNDIGTDDCCLKVNHVGYRQSVFRLGPTEGDSREIVIYLKPRLITMPGMVVTGEHSHSKFDELEHLAGTLTGQDLQRELGMTLAATLKNETGLAMRTMGPAPARPVIRGLGGDRVIINEDGNKSTDLSATSPDHAVTIEPFGLERVEVLRGPRVLLHTSTAVAGVVNVVRHEIPQDWHDKTYGTVGGFGASANKAGLGLLSLELPLSRLLLRTEVSGKRSDDLRTPAGVLDNSSVEQVDYNVGGSYISEFGFVGASFHRFKLDYGVPGGFVGAHPNGVDIDMLRQQHNLRSRLDLRSSAWENLEFNFNRAYYRHREFEAGGLLGSEFRIVNYFGRIDLRHRELGPFDRGTFGISFDLRDFDIGGHVFTPPSRSSHLALFVFEGYSNGRLSLEAALRAGFDWIKPDYEDPDAAIGAIAERSFENLSASVSGIYAIADHFNLGANLSRSARVPTIEELYSQGPHLAAYSYEIGNPNLHKETGLSAELFAYHDSDRIDAMVTLFGNDISGYVVHRNTGDTNWATFLPIYAAEGVDALLYGAETQAELFLTERLSLSGSLTYTRGELTDGNRPLPEIPPHKSELGLHYNSDNLSLHLRGLLADAQERVDEFEQPTAGYAICGVQAQYRLVTRGLIHLISVSGDNIFDTTYRNHLSRLKSIMPEAGRSLRVAYKLHFEL
jgi:iron complex outermembrane receptor protein